MAVTVAVRYIEAIANIKEFKRQDSGSLEVTAIARTPGILTYYDSNGPRRELVTTAFLRSSDQSGFPIAGGLANLPVTLEHPPALLRKDAGKIKQYGVGKTGPEVHVSKDGQIKVVMEVEREDAIAAIESGEKRGVSLGYLCNIARKDGTYEGARYDAEQCAPFEADHLAIVANPRAKNALIQSFERTDDATDIAVAYFEEFETNSNVVDSPRSDSMGTETAATVAISDVAKVTPEKFQIDIGGQPFHVDSNLYEAIKTERADMSNYKKDMGKGKKGKKGKKASMNDEYMEEDDDDEYEDGVDEARKDAADQISSLLARCDADTLSDAIYNLNVLIGRFDSVDTVADVVDAIDGLQGQLKIYGDSEDDEGKDRYDADDISALLKKLDAKTPADALRAIEGREFISNYAHMLPPDFKFDGQTLQELQLAAITHLKPGVEIRSDSAAEISGAFSILSKDNRRVDNSAQLDAAFRQDMVNSSPGAGANRSTGTPMIQPPHDSLFSLSKAVRESGAN